MNNNLKLIQIFCEQMLETNAEQLASTALDSSKKEADIRIKAGHVEAYAFIVDAIKDLERVGDVSFAMNRLGIKTED